MSSVWRQSINTVLIGDPRVGKTRLIYKLLHSQLQPYTVDSSSNDVYSMENESYHYKETLFDSFRIVHILNQFERVIINIFDTAGAERYDKIRKQTYKNAHVIVICYDVSDIESAKNVFLKWVPDIASYKKMYMVVGLCSNRNTDNFGVKYVEKIVDDPMCFCSMVVNLCDNSGVLNFVNCVVEASNVQKTQKERKNLNKPWWKKFLRWCMCY
ncbi:small GTP-binding protein domain [Edhazardia aedis USNM 41457]|uniref:Small GTP-binding protein domain n=1 Tax=Edhazardia aedis (strain USNM 41457) TaxID=1003232 RepID=J9DPI2_EDHAE|nr:small GTP-binding protein domain [Edhazardia aedis USNM 41457]|eukprot:EJW04460.1 small GTP-binding protein domain [Edhazardia aedis USNM 41457]